MQLREYAKRNSTHPVQPINPPPHQLFLPKQQPQLQQCFIPNPTITFLQLNKSLIVIWTSYDHNLRPLEAISSFNASIHVMHAFICPLIASNLNQFSPSYITR